MRRFWAGAAAASALLLGAMAATLLVPVGFALWHYNAAFVVALVVTALAWRPLQRRRVATLALAFTGIAAVVTGFVMLYSRQLVHKEWITWWHSVTSFAMLLAFLLHWSHNQPRLWDFTKRLFARARPTGPVVVGAWLGVILAGAWTTLPHASARFTSENYLLLSSLVILALGGLAYGAWLAYRLPPLRARLQDVSHRNCARALVDTSLFLANWGAMLTGFALLYFAEPLREGPLKYVSKWWHTTTSVALLALLALHIGFNARPLAAHARRVDAELRRESF